MKTSDAQKIVVQAPDAGRHEEMLDLIAKTFSTWHGYWQFLGCCRNGFLVGSHFDPKVSRIGILDGKVVTNWSVYDYRMRIGRCAVRAGGVGVVATHADYRKRGLMVPTGMGSISAMREQGYDLTLLFGLHNFYHHFGYLRAFPEQTYTISAEELPKGVPAPALKPFTPPRADLEALYNRASEGLTGMAIRPTFPKKAPLPNGQPAPDGWYWVDKSGMPAGSVMAADRGSHLDIREAVGDPSQVLAVFAKLCEQFHLKEVRVGALHYDSPLAAALRRLTCRLDFGYTRNGGAMVRLVNLRSTLTKIAPELSRRLAASPMDAWKGKLLIEYSQEKVVLEIAKSKVAVTAGASAPNAIRGGDEIAQFLIGVDEPMEIVEHRKTRLSGQAKALLPVLFPNQHPMLANWDRF